MLNLFAFAMASSRATPAWSPPCMDPCASAPAMVMSMSTLRSWLSSLGMAAGLTKSRYSQMASAPLRLCSLRSSSYPVRGATVLERRQAGRVRAPDCWALLFTGCLLYTSPSPRDRTRSRMPSSA
eukprot:TRINITY_DN1379_c0_g2_i3.p1 TRINITY_DN1379_c0_g2~~TRINITY_DN1379_c0_g2_i3.p1  ORF type:complete len:125 (+),score=17.40 TRINITY_DN1379_c0_g2_i3:342-716(+)